MISLIFSFFSQTDWLFLNTTSNNDEPCIIQLYFFTRHLHHWHCIDQPFILSLLSLGLLLWEVVTVVVADADMIVVVIIIAYPTRVWVASFCGLRHYKVVMLRMPVFTATHNCGEWRTVLVGACGSHYNRCDGIAGHVADGRWVFNSSSPLIHIVLKSCIRLSRIFRVVKSHCFINFWSWCCKGALLFHVDSYETIFIVLRLAKTDAFKGGCSSISRRFLFVRSIASIVIWAVWKNTHLLNFDGNKIFFSWSDYCSCLDDWIYQILN